MMQAVSILAPAFAPLAIKLIDKYIFDDGKQRRSRPRAVAAPRQIVCCCGRSYDDYGSETRTCSTCSGTNSSGYRPSKLTVPTGSSARSSSTSDAYDKNPIKSPHARRARTHSESETKSMKCLTYSDHRNHQNYHQRSSCASHNDDTLAVLAGHIKRQISPRSCQAKVSLHGRPSIILGSTENEGKTSSRIKMADSKCATSTTCSTRKSRGKCVVEWK